MRRLVSRLITLILIIVVISIVISFFQAPGFKQLTVEIPDSEEASGRVKKINYSVPVMDSSGYSVKAWRESLGMPATGNAYTPVDVNFYNKNKMNGIVYEIKSADLLQKDNELNLPLADKIIDYLTHLRLKSGLNAEKETQLPVTHIQFLSFRDGINYSANTGSEVKALASQFRFTAKLQLKYTRCITAVIELGTYDNDTLRNQGNFAPNYAVSVSVNNIYSALKSVQSEYPESKFCIAFKNSPPYKTSELPAGGDPTRLKSAYDLMIQQNAAWGNIVPQLDDRLSVIIDTSAVFHALATTSLPLNDANGKRHTSSSLLDQLKSQLLLKTYTGDITNRYLSSLVVSFFSTAKEGGENSGNLPFTRAESAREVMEQLSFTAELINISSLGLEPTKGHNSALIVSIPRREVFPLLHHVARPLANNLGLLRKADGAQRSEQTYSIELIKKYLAYKLR